MHPRVLRQPGRDRRAGVAAQVVADDVELPAGVGPVDLVQPGEVAGGVARRPGAGQGAAVPDPQGAGGSGQDGASGHQRRRKPLEWVRRARSERGPGQLARVETTRPDSQLSASRTAATAGRRGKLVGDVARCS